MLIGHNIGSGFVGFKKTINYLFLSYTILSKITRIKFLTLNVCKEYKFQKFFLFSIRKCSKIINEKVKIMFIL